MKRKVVIKVNRKDHKSRSKALKIVINNPGVEMVALSGKDGNQIELIGDSVDAAALTALLRQKVGYAVLESVRPVGEKKEERASEPKAQTESYIYEVSDCYPDPSCGCSIM